jgi:hypothetical protein
VPSRTTSALRFAEIVSGLEAGCDLAHRCAQKGFQLPSSGRAPPIRLPR